MTDLVRFTDLTISRWPNGAGRKADVAAGPGWLVSFAWLDTDAPFSDYTGQDRTITLLEGAGFDLVFSPPHSVLSVRQPFAPARFDGGWPATCHLPAGPCVVLNAMTARIDWVHAVTVLAQPVALPEEASVRFLVVLQGSCTLAGSPPAGPRDTFMLPVAGAAVAGSPDLRVAVVAIRPAR